MNKAWIAMSLATTVLLIGCRSEPQAIAPVPGPGYSQEPVTLPPVVINEEPPPVSIGSPNANDPRFTPPGTGSFDPEPLPPVQPANRTYTIRKGDTYWAIATRVYGNGQRWVDIARANPSVDPKKLVIGQQIVLP